MINFFRFLKEIGTNNSIKFYLIAFLSISTILLEALSLTLIFPILGILSGGVELLNKPLIKNSLEFFNFDISTNTDFYNNILNYILITFFCLIILKNVLTFFINWFSLKFLKNLKISTSNTIFSSYLKRNYIFHLKNNSNFLIKNVLDEVQNLFTVIFPAILILISETFMFLLLIVILVLSQPSDLLFILFLMGVLSLSFVAFTKKKLKSWGTKRLNLDRLKLKNARESLNLIKDILMQDKSNFFIKRHNYFNNGGAAIELKESVLRTLPKSIFEIFAITFVVTSFYIFFSLGYDSKEIIPQLGLATIIIIRFIPSANKITTSLNIINFSKPVIDLAYNELNVSKLNLLEDKNDKIFIDKFNNEIRLENILVNLDGSKNILNGLNFEIKKNTIIGLFGSSGSGKTTLKNIICGIIKPQEGNYFIDGKIVDFNKINIFRFISSIPQHVELYEDSIMQNIAFGESRENIDVERVNRVIQECELDDFVKRNKGISSLIREDGQNLSGGERQRLGLARALYNNPSLLILDESTNSLDKITEKQILSLLNRLKDKLSIIMISHDLEVFKNCDKIYKLTQGKLTKL